MPQALSKCRNRLRWSVSIPVTNGQCETVRIQRKRNKCHKRLKQEFPPVTITAREDEDWEKEIEEFSSRTQKEMAKKMKCQNSYDPEDDLNVVVDPVTLYGVPSGLGPIQVDYSPSVHHIPPVKWVHHVYTIVVGQFADAEE